MDRQEHSLLRALRRKGRLGVLAVLAAGLVALAFPAVTDRASSEPAERIALDDLGVTIEFRAADGKVAAEVASICRKYLPVLSRQLGLVDVEPFRVFLLSDVRAYEERMGFSLPSWGVAFAFAADRLMLVDVPRATKEWDTLDKVIPHELSHLLLGQRAPGIRFPLWFIEGLAQWQADEWSVLESWRLMEAVWSNRAPALGQVVSYMPAEETRARDAYRVSYAAFQYRFGEQTERLGLFLDEVVRRGDFGAAFEAFWSETPGQFGARFDEQLARRYSSRLMLFQPAPLFTLASVLFVFVFLRIWIRNRIRLKRMEKMEREP